MAPNNFLEKHKRDKYLALNLSFAEKEMLKREALGKFGGGRGEVKGSGGEIGMDDLLEVEGKGEDEGKGDVLGDDIFGVVSGYKEKKSKANFGGGVEGKNFNGSNVKGEIVKGAEEAKEGMMEEEEDLSFLMRKQSDVFEDIPDGYGKVGHVKPKTEEMVKKEDTVESKLVDGWLLLPEQTGLIRRGAQFDTFGSILKKCKTNFS